MDSVEDREKIHQTVAVLKEQYESRLQAATSDFNKAQHEMNRASHELARLEKHLNRINDFCKKHNIRLETV